MTGLRSAVLALLIAPFVVNSFDDLNAHAADR
jgi:hypothetical protein